MALIPDDDKELWKRIVEEVAKAGQIPVRFLSVDWARGSSETVFHFATKPDRKPGWQTFNEAVAEELKWKVKFKARPSVYKAHIHWEDGQPVAYCPECGNRFAQHAEDGSCPDIIDAEFKEDDPPLLPSGKE